MDRVLKQQLQATAFCWAGHGHIHVVQVKLRTPGLQARLTRLVDIRRPWGDERKDVLGTTIKIMQRSSTYQQTDEDRKMKEILEFL